MRAYSHLLFGLGSAMLAIGMASMAVAQTSSFPQTFEERVAPFVLQSEPSSCGALVASPAFVMNCPFSDLLSDLAITGQVRFSGSPLTGTPQFPAGTPSTTFSLTFTRGSGGTTVSFQDNSDTHQEFGFPGIEAAVVCDANQGGGGGGGQGGNPGNNCNAYCYLSWSDDRDLTSPSGAIGSVLACYSHGPSFFQESSVTSTCAAFRPDPVDFFTGMADANERESVTGCRLDNAINADPELPDDHDPVDLAADWCVPGATPDEFGSGRPDDGLCNAERAVLTGVENFAVGFGEGSHSYTGGTLTIR